MTQALIGVEMESPDPEELARHWGQIIGIPASQGNNDETQIVLPNCTFSFVKGFREIMSALTFRVSDVAKVGNTSVAWEAGKAVVTFPIPGVPGATGKATLDAKYMAERVVVTQGATTTEFTYSGYQDWNNPLNKIGVLYAGKMVERRNGAVVRDLTTDVTETGNVYVVAPVPAAD